jgi:hypothetical protein
MERFTTWYYVLYIYVAAQMHPCIQYMFFLLSVDFGASIWPTTAWRHSTFLGCIRRFAAALVETPIIVGSNPNLILSSITLFC